MVTPVRTDENWEGITVQDQERGELFLALWPSPLTPDPSTSKLQERLTDSTKREELAQLREEQSQPQPSSRVAEHLALPLVITPLSSRPPRPPRPPLRPSSSLRCRELAWPVRSLACLGGGAELTLPPPSHRDGQRDWLLQARASRRSRGLPCSRTHAPVNLQIRRQLGPVLRLPNLHRHALRPRRLLHLSRPLRPLQALRPGLRPPGLQARNRGPRLLHRRRGNRQQQDVRRQLPDQAWTD